LNCSLYQINIARWVPYSFLESSLPTDTLSPSSFSLVIHAMQCHAGDDVAPAAPKTMDAFNAEQRRMQEQTRLSQLNAAESLHQYRGTVDEEELKRRAAAEELRRKEIEARKGLHGYRAKQFDGARASPAAKTYQEADVRAGERRDDVMSGNISGYQVASAGDESLVAAAAAEPSLALPRGGDETNEDGIGLPDPSPESSPAIAAPDAAAPEAAAPVAAESSAIAPEPQQSEAFEDETPSESANAAQYSKEISALSDVSGRAKLMRQNITFSFGFICKADVAPSPIIFNPTEDHKDFEAKVKAGSASGADGDNAWIMLGRMMSTTENIVQQTTELQNSEGIVYDPDYKPYVVRVTDDVSFAPPANQPDVVRRVIKATVPVFIRSGHVESTKSAQRNVVNALRAACAGGAFSEAALSA